MSRVHRIKCACLVLPRLWFYHTEEHAEIPLGSSAAGTPNTHWVRKQPLSANNRYTLEDRDRVFKTVTLGRQTLSL